MFNRSLYKDMFAQLRTAGFIFTVISIVASIITPSMEFFQKQSYYRIDYPFIPTILTITPVLFFMTFLAGLMLVLIAFSFLNKRNASDYYHSLPDTRIAIFTSFSLAVLTWIVILVVSTVLITSMVYFALGFAFNVSYIGYLIFAFITATSLVSAVTALAMSITGTLLSNLMLAGLIGFLPRVVGMVISLGILEITPVATYKTFGLLDASYNLPVAFIGSMARLCEKRIDELLFFKEGILYTACLALVYFVIAGFFFRIRKSETADKNAPNKILQHTYRCAFALPFLFPTIMLFYVRDLMLPTAIVFLVISLLAYFIYEVITTKTAKNLIKIAPMYVVVLAVAGVMVGSVHFVSQSILSNTLTPQTIQSIQFIAPTYSGGEKSYLQAQTQKIEFEEEEIKETVCKLINQTPTLIEQRAYVGERTVKITLKNKATLQRKFVVNSQDIDKLDTLTINNPEYMQQIRKVPTDKELRSIILPSHLFTQEEKQELFSIYKQEIATISDEAYWDLMIGGYNTQNIILESYDVVSRVGKKDYIDRYHLTSLTPKSAAYFTAITNQHNQKMYEQELERIQTYLINSQIDTQPSDYERLENATELSALVRIPEQDVTKDSGYFQADFTSGKFYTNSKLINLEEIKQILAMLQQQKLPHSGIDASKPYAHIRIKLSKSSPYASNGIDGYIQLSLEQAQALIEIRQDNGF